MDAGVLTSHIASRDVEALQVLVYVLRLKPPVCQNNSWQGASGSLLFRVLNTDTCLSACINVIFLLNKNS